MKSIPYKKHRGEGVPPVTTTPNPAPLASQPCNYVNKRGQHCQTPSVDTSGLCGHHIRHARRQEAAAAKAVSAEVLAGVDDFESVAAVNLFLGNLVKQVVLKRVARQDALALAYLSQLLLNSLSAMSREQQQRADEKKRLPPTLVWDGVFSSKSGVNPETYPGARPPAEKPAENPRP